MTFLFDENFPKSARTLLEGRSHTVIDFRMDGVVGADDSEVIELAQRNSAVILTTDRDFFHTLGRQHPDHHGIVVIALKKPTRSLILARLFWFLDHVDAAEIPGRAFQLRDQSWQVYPALKKHGEEE
jgi:predicted nuclease of predicted toxin-antitoxin system